MRSSLRFALGEAIVAAWICFSWSSAALAQDLGWGRTHADWESQALRSTLHFESSIATAVRYPSGLLKATLTSREGEALAEVEFVPGRAHGLRLKVRQKGEQGWKGATEIPYTSPEPPVLDWLNLQLYSWANAVPDEGKGLVQPERPSAKALKVVSELKAAELDFGAEYSRSLSLGNGFITHLWERKSKFSRPNGREVPQGEVVGDTLVAVLIWRGDQQTLLFSVGAAPPQGRQFYRLTAEDLPDGYFPFQPDMAWANVQARQLWNEQAKRLGTIYDKNTAGCDGGLHWLDGTSLRRCCDAHDRCYEAHSRYTGAPCQAESWFWPFCAPTPSCTWRCQICNIEAVACFFIPKVDTFYQPGSPGSGGCGEFSCELAFPGYCPPYCSSCCVV